jgi:hypothetical protein
MCLIHPRAGAVGFGLAALALVVAFGGAAVGSVQATPLTHTTFGQPVEASGSGVAAVPTLPGKEHQAFVDPATNTTEYFVPLSDRNAGVFGVTSVGYHTAGTRSDLGRGTGLTDSALRMFMRFEPATSDVQSARFEFHFDDLDLNGLHDPNGFRESLRLFDADGEAMTSWITDATQTPGNADAYDFAISGDRQQQTVTVEGVESLVSDSTWVELRFGADSGFFGRNTAEAIQPKLITTTGSDPVPEPATLTLCALGGAALLARRRRRAGA